MATESIEPYLNNCKYYFVKCATFPFFRNLFVVLLNVFSGHKNVMRKNIAKSFLLLNISNFILFGEIKFKILFQTKLPRAVVAKGKSNHLRIQNET